EYGCGLAPLGEYRVGIHVGAIFIILIASALGVGLPIVLQRHPDAAARSSTGFLSKVISESFFVLKHASYGIIVAVCFVHLLIHAFIYLGNECVQPLAYEATAASITMGGVLFVFIVDFLLLHSIRRKAAQAQDAVTQAHSASASPTKGEVAECGILDPEATGSIGDETLAEDVRQAKANMQVFELLIFELSILLHSVIIGVTLGASDGSGWSTLLIAVVFHQLFEGFALGARIAELPHRVGGPLKKFLMATAFALITPVGIAIGMGSRYSWNPNDRSTLLVMGILQSISAGALLWSALVEMIAGDYLYGPMARASLGRGMVGIISLLIGAVLMSVLAQWA
ncbi:Zinc/iron permease, partial [Tilletiaria anomala UBC 951]